ncbi:rhamnogalacturonan acetylesterase [Planctomicrobium sp. SH664]|uniref:rhamnogalacturonan acetylesterase n=1 Tax=Planctomicrobium sp. SH664 TaxID=3448125 RepID=UPI003F5C1552
MNRIVQVSGLWCLLATCLQAADEPGKIKIVLVGDSTVANHTNSDPKVPPLAGWGQVFHACMTDQVQIVNLAASGRSSKSYIKENRWDKALAEKPDYVLIQFGHNDCPGKGKGTTDPNGDFRDYIRQYIRDSRGIGARPILITPVARRTFRDGEVTSTLTPYADAMIAIGEEEKVPVVDLHASSMTLYKQLGDSGSTYLNCTPQDRTHFSPPGALIIAALVAHRLPDVEPSLKPYVIKQDEPGVFRVIGKPASN